MSLQEIQNAVDSSQLAVKSVADGDEWLQKSGWLQPQVRKPNRHPTHQQFTIL